MLECPSNCWMYLISFLINLDLVSAPQFTPISLKIIQVNNKIFYVHLLDEQNNSLSLQSINLSVQTLAPEI